MQMAAVLVLEPIFEADLRPEQYAYRPGRSALDAVMQVQALLDAGYTDVVDADLSGYFDTLPHAELLKSLGRRLSDGRLLALLKSWLEMPVEETDDRGNQHRRTTTPIGCRSGRPQGLSDQPVTEQSLHEKVCADMEMGREALAEAYVVNYADDFVILCRGRAEEAMAEMRNMMRKLKLTVNEKKTRDCRLPEEKFDFPGVYVRAVLLAEDGQGVFEPRSLEETKLQRLGRSYQQTDRRTCKAGRWRRQAWASSIAMLRGWANYFCLGPVRKAYCRGHASCPAAAASMAVCEAQGAATGSTHYSQRDAAWRVGPVPT